MKSSAIIRLGGLCAALWLVLAAAENGDRTVRTQAGQASIEQLADGLDHPWGMALLPDGRLLVTERDAGALRIVGTDGELSPPLEGTPEVLAQGQGGLLDVALDPDFDSNRLIYLSYAEPGTDGATTALGRGQLVEGEVRDFQVIFRQQPRVNDSKHFGGRIVFAPTGELFLTLGERYQFDPAQDPANHLGAIVRLLRDGSIPPDNPLLDQTGAAKEIWSYGHRNVESAAIDPKTGALWVAEMGPRGGDELNRPAPGRNYGWPEVSWGEHYNGTDIPDPPTRPEFADAALQWTPVISPSGMLVYTGETFPEWQGSLLIGGLSAKGLVRVVVDGERAREVERIALGERIRDVEQGPDGSVYILTDADDGKLLRMVR